MQKLKLLIMIFSVVLVSCKEEPKQFNDDSVIKITGETQGTTYTILYYDTLNRNIKVAVDSILARIDSSLSTYKPNSIISKFNKAKDCSWIDSHFLELFFTLRVKIFLMRFFFGKKCNLYGFSIIHSILLQTATDDRP